MLAIRDSQEGEGSGSFASNQSSLLFVDPLPPIPTMAATTLQLELLLHNPLLDLRTISGVILSDVGATLQILRLIGEEFCNEQERPTRMEDCIVSLQSDCWYEAIRKQSASLNVRVVNEWQRCRRRGEYARELASCFADVSPHEAYVVGLLHRLGEFPHLLGWSKVESGASDHHSMGLMLAEFWQLPPYLICAIREQQASSIPSVWRELLHLSGQLADPV